MLNGMTLNGDDLRRLERLDYIALWQAEKVIRTEMMNLYDENNGFSLTSPEKQEKREAAHEQWLAMKKIADFLNKKRLTLLDEEPIDLLWLTERP